MATLNPYSDSLLMDALRGSLSNAESLGRGFAVAPVGLLGDVNALARQYITPRLPSRVQGLLQAAPAAPTTEQILANIPRASAPRMETSGMEQLGAAMNPRGPVELAKAVKNMPVGLSIKDVGTFKFPQEEAMRLAQQRAALPKEQGGLGLLENNTAAERAAAMSGKEAIHFSRTGGDFNVLDSGQYAVAPFDAVGTHVGTKEAALERFKNTSGTIDTPKGSSYPVQVLGDRPLMNEQGLPWGEDELNAFLRQSGEYNSPNAKMTYQDMNKELRKKLFEEQGYTSIPYVNDVEAKGVVSYIVPPDNLRSRFAAFDPFRRTAATAAAMGVAAPDLLAQEQPVITQQQIDDELAKYGLLGR